MKAFNLLWIALVVVDAKADRSSSCRFLNTADGICVPVQDCPLLSSIWNEATSETDHFKSLICGGQNNEFAAITVCCPSTNFNTSPSSLMSLEGDSDKDPPVAALIDEVTETAHKIYFPQNPFEDLKPVNINDFHTKSFESHKNFHLLPTLSECGNSVSFGDRIVGGENSNHGEFPWTVQLGFYDPKKKKLIFDCGGAIINSHYIVTAAHCVLNTLKITTVRLGEYNSATELDCSESLNCSKAEDVSVEQVIIHHRFQMDPDHHRFNDIALLRVKPEIQFDSPFIQPICIPFAEDYNLVEYLNEDYLEMKKSYAVGWGLTDYTDSKKVSDIMKKVVLPIHTFASCRKTYEEFGKLISPKQICVGGNSGDTCDGDSGGPIMLPLTVRIHQKLLKIKYFLLGIVSYGPRECGLHPIPGISTRITAYLDWILDNLEA